MLKRNSNIINWLFFIYFCHMTAIIFLGDAVFDFNPITYFLFVIIYFMKGRIDRNTIAIICFFLMLIFFVSLGTNFKTIKDLMYLFQDVFTIIFIFFSLYLIGNERMNEKLQRNMSNIFIFYIFLYFIMLMNPNLYDSELGIERYHGIFGSTNVSSTTILLFLIFIWEYKKISNKSSKCYFLFVLSVFILVLFFSKSRSLLFFIPYLCFQVYFIFSSFLSKFLFFLVIFLVGCLGLILLDLEYVSEILRLKGDSSFTTRGLIMELVLDRIKENYSFFPSGHNSAVPYLSNILGEVRYPLHNDFVKYIFEWGVVGVLFILSILGSFISKKFNINDLLIFLFAISGILHNIFFLFYIWVPMIFIFTMKNSFLREE